VTAVVASMAAAASMEGVQQAASTAEVDAAAFMVADATNNRQTYGVHLGPEQEHLPGPLLLPAITSKWIRVQRRTRLKNQKSKR
jgi:hypothetical protein